MSETSTEEGDRPAGKASPNPPAPTLDYPSPRPADAASEAATLAPPLSSGAAPPVADTGIREAAIRAGYEILGELGRGGMGVVYKARQVGLNRLVALKMILAGGHAGLNELTRFRTEAEAVARLQHPNIVQIHEVGEVEGRPFFSLEFVDGGSLADQLDGTPWPPRQAARLIETLARAIHAAHQQDIIHRDLKPANVLLQIGEPRAPMGRQAGESTFAILQSAIPKITDFGLAKRLDSAGRQTQSGAILGTPSYMAPEQAGAKGREIGPPTDVYALGAILYELLTGRPPFKALLPLDTVLQVVNEEPVRPSRLQPKLPRDLETICLKCLNKEPGKRYGSAAALADELRRFLADEPIMARPASPWERAGKWARRRPALAALLAVSAVALLALVAVGLAYQRRLQLSNVQLQEQRDDAERAKTDLEKEHKRAEAHLHNALQVVDRLMTHVGSERLAKVPELEDLRQQMLKEALDFYRGFLLQESDDPAVRWQTASANLKAAKLYFLMGNLREAEDHGKEALKLQENLVADFPAQPEYRNDLSKSHVFLSFLYGMTGRFQAAMTTLDKARLLGEELTRQHPDNADFQRGLAETYSSLGFANMWSRAPQATTHFRNVVRLAERLARDHPDSADDRCLLATGHGYLGMVMSFDGPTDQAEQELRRALDLLQPADGAPPKAGKDYQQILATVHVFLGRVHFQKSRLEEAVALLPRGIASYEELLKDSPKDIGRRLQLAMSYPILGRLYMECKQWDRAERALHRALELLEPLVQEFPKMPYFAPMANDARLFAMILSLRRGELPNDFAKAQQLAKTKDAGGALYYNLACVYALASKAVSPDQGLAEDYARRALELLKRSAAAGYLRSAAHIKHARNDDDLKPLWERADFQELLSDLEAKAIPSESSPPSP